MHTLFKLVMFAICFHVFQPCNGKVKIHSLSVPRFVENGTEESIILDCLYTLDPIEDKNLVVKWFLNDNPEPIYLWLQELKLNRASERLHGRINLDFTVNSGDPHTQYRALNILRPTIELSGRYACQVLSLSSQDSEDETMIVYAKPKYFDFNYTLRTNESDLALRSQSSPLHYHRYHRYHRYHHYHPLRSSLSLKTEQSNETHHNSSNTILICPVSDVFPVPDITIYRVSDKDTNFEILYLNATNVKRNPNGAYNVTVTSDIRDNELTEKYDSHENRFVCDVRLTDGTQNIYQTNKSITYFTDKTQSVLQDTKTIPQIDLNDTNKRLINLKLIVEHSIIELIESIKLHANTTDFEYFKEKIIQSVDNTYTALEVCKTELSNTKTLLENSNSANFTDHKNEIAKHRKNSTKGLLLFNNQSNQTRSDSNTNIKTKTDMNSIAFIDCQSSDVWNDCKLFVDSKKNVSQIIARPKYLNEKHGSWDKAMNICTKYNYSSVSIESHEKKLFFYRNFGGASNFRVTTYWTSGRINSDGKWIWNSSGNELTDDNWVRRALNSVTKTECISINEYQWTNVPCKSNFGVMCEFDIDVNKIPESTNNEINNTKLFDINTALNDCLSNDVWINCKLFIDHKRNTTQIIAKPITDYMYYKWDEAMDICTKYNSSLVSIESEDKQKFVSPFVGSKWYWTSGTKNSDSKWLWNSTGDEFTFTNWDEHHTPNTTIIECLTTNFDKWNNALCDQKWGVLCEFQINITHLY